MTSTIPEQISNVSVKLKANVYFEGGVISHTLVSANGQRQSVGIIRAGSYHFNTDAAERMAIVAGTCRVKLKDEKDFHIYSTGQSFDVPAKNGFDIVVEQGITEYLCTFS